MNLFKILSVTLVKKIQIIQFLEEKHAFYCNKN